MNPKITLLHEAFVSARCVTNTLWQNREATKLCISGNLSCSEIKQDFLKELTGLKYL